MNSIQMRKFFKLGLLFMLAACQATAQPLSAETFGPGDTIGGMRLTTGSADAPALQAFCSPAQRNGNTAVSDCNVPSLPRLAVGQVFLVADHRLAELDWSELTWEFYVDDRAVDVERFGTYDMLLPAMPGSPSPVREVIKRSLAWDVVLTNLTPGEHTLRGKVRTGTESYGWAFNLNVEASPVGEGLLWTGIQKIS